MAFQWTFDLSKNEPVFVEKESNWYEARLRGASGSWDSAQQKIVEWYTVDYSDPDLGPNETVVVDKIKKADDPFILNLLKSGDVPQKLYDLATREGIDEMVAAHNKWRAEVGSPPVVWDPQLAESAQEWADILLGLDVMKHSSHEERDNKGENLFWSSDPYTTPTQVVDSWGSEIEWYNYDDNSCQAPPGAACGHYTQVVWQETTKIGAAVTKDEDDVYWVCRYDPPGNLVGKKPY